MRLFCLYAAIIPLACAFFGRNAKVAKTFRSSKITPDIIPTPPEEFLHINYPKAEVCLGEMIAQTRTIAVPTIEYDFKSNENYTLVFIDPDSPSALNPSLQSYLSWLVVNINAKAKCGEGESETIARYIPPTSPGSGVHRYTFVLYKQSRPLDMKELLKLRLGVKRYRFDVVAFAKEFCLGDPVAGNFFRARTPAVYSEYYCTNCSISSRGKSKYPNKYLLSFGEKH